MARVISTNETFTTCPHCGATIAYSKADVRSGIDEDRDRYSNVTCPQCRHSISTLKPLYDAGDFDL